MDPLMKDLAELTMAHVAIHNAIRSSCGIENADALDALHRGIQQFAIEKYSPLLGYDHDQVRELIKNAIDFAASRPRNPDRAVGPDAFYDLFGAMTRLYTYAERKLGVFGDVEMLPINYEGELQGCKTYCQNSGTYRHSPLVGSGAISRSPDELVRHETSCGITYVQIGGDWYTPDGRFIYFYSTVGDDGRERSAYKVGGTFDARSIDMLSETYLYRDNIRRPYIAAPAHRASMEAQS